MKNDIPQSVRDDIQERSNGVCEYCHRQRAAHLHHLKHRSQGGKHEIGNLIHLCVVCHTKVHQEYEFFKEFEKRLTKVVD